MKYNNLVARDNDTLIGMPSHALRSLEGYNKKVTLDLRREHKREDVSVKCVAVV